MPTAEEINSIDYWEERKALASRNHANRAAAMEHVAEAEREILRIKRQQAVAARLGSADVPTTPRKGESSS